MSTIHLVLPHRFVSDRVWPERCEHCGSTQADTIHSDPQSVQYRDWQGLRRGIGAALLATTAVALIIAITIYAIKAI